jgi:hypothetical protein
VRRLWPGARLAARAEKGVTLRRVTFWLVLLPLTIGVWALVLLPRPSTPPAYVEKLREPVPSTLPPVRPVSSYTVCGIAGAENCWQVGGIPR